jgi:hypothetical protein
MRDQWRLVCDCGWSVEVRATSAGRVKTGEQIQLELDPAFVAHLGPDERRLYVLVDQRQVECRGRGEDEPSLVARGNFLMPEGRRAADQLARDRLGSISAIGLEPKRASRGCCRSAKSGPPMGGFSGSTSRMTKAAPAIQGCDLTGGEGPGMPG